MSFVYFFVEFSTAFSRLLCYNLYQVYDLGSLSTCICRRLRIYLLRENRHACRM